MNCSFAKLEIFVPPSHLDAVRDALASVDAGHIGGYDRCLSRSQVIGQWRALPGCDPYEGEVGEVCESPEIKVECTVRASDLERTIAAVRAAHPYEEPVINAIPLMATGLSAAGAGGRPTAAEDAAELPTASSQEAIARSIAREAHAGQLDKAGRPYIDHPASVAAMVEGDEAKAVAWLHDVVEDHGDQWPLERLREAGLSEAVVRGVDAMTHRDGEDYLDFVRRAAEDPLARQVKLADVRHNMDLTRLASVKARDVDRIEHKYLPALKILVLGE